MKSRIALALLLSALSAAWAPAQVPAGGEFRVNAYTTGDEHVASVASDASGNFVVAWTGQSDVFAQRYDSSGLPRGSAFQVNAFTTGWQYVPRVASDAAGRFVVTWSSYPGQFVGEGVFARRYGADGAPRGFPFQVNTYTPWGQYGQSVASDPAGNFVVVWQSTLQDGSLRGVFGQRYAASGAARGSEFQVNTYTYLHQWEPSVASDAAGNFVVAWASGQDGSLQGVFAQRYDATGSPRGAEFQVNTYTTNFQYRPSVASDAAGNFVVVWLSPDGSDYGVFAQRYDASGSRRGSEFQVNVQTASGQYEPTVASDAAGNVVVAWLSPDGSSYGVFARRYDASGAPRGTVFRVNTHTTNEQRGPAVASDVAGNFVVAWESYGQDGSELGVFAQRFGGIVPGALGVDTVASAGSDGNHVLEPGESVDVRPSWRNVNGAAQTFDGNVLSFSGPPASGVSYQLLDGIGAYDTVPNGATAPCSDCYQVAVAFGGTRPSVHWDAPLTERLTPDALGQMKTWSIHVGDSFTDVPRTSPYYRFVETLLHKGVTAGCASGAYCPSSSTTREQMAAFVLLAKEGAGYAPPPCAPPNLFADVPETSIFCDVIEELARRNVVGGCGGGNYCPTSGVTREQMPIFVLRTLDPGSSPPACTPPIFADVPASSPFCRWIEELARRGVVTGCGGGNYCPAALVTREQMAVFVGGTFGMTLYGPWSSRSR